MTIRGERRVYGVPGMTGVLISLSTMMPFVQGFMVIYPNSKWLVFTERMCALRDISEVDGQGRRRDMSVWAVIS